MTRYIIIHRNDTCVLHFAEETKQECEANDSCIVNIDSDMKDPQACSLYAPDIYSNIRVIEVGSVVFISKYSYTFCIFPLNYISLIFDKHLDHTMELPVMTIITLWNKLL